MHKSQKTLAAEYDISVKTVSRIRKYIEATDPDSIEWFGDKPRIDADAFRRAIKERKVRKP